MNALDLRLREILNEYLLAIADDELILGHRDSQWCGHAPILEADISFANIALDEIGHAGALYARLAELKVQDPETYPDRLVFFRELEDYRCAQMVELPNRDWAFSMLRQYLFDTLEQTRLPLLAESAYAPLAELAAKMIPEERYHQRHTSAWIRRLSLGTVFSHARVQDALDELWPFTAQLLRASEDDKFLAAERLIPDPALVREEWQAGLDAFFKECGLRPPQIAFIEPPRSQHSPYLRELLADLQKVARLEPNAKW